MKPKDELPVDEVRRLLKYEPETGELFWRVGMPPNARAGDQAGGPTKSGYWRITIRKRTFCAHRLAWVLQTGEWPTLTIDHWDTDKGNNRWRNLRQATISQNVQNCGCSAANSSGFKGVSKSKSGWKSTIKKNGKNLHLGHFLTAIEAAEAYRLAAIKLHGEFLHASLR